MIRLYDVRIARTQLEKEDAFSVRRTVFIMEQQVPAEIEMDQHDQADADTIHIVAYHDNRPVGAARLRAYSPNIGKVERVAVVKSERGTGLGRQLMQAIEEASIARGFTQVKLYSQCHAQPFYDKLGYSTVGETFMDAGIEHIEMNKIISAPN